MYNADVVRLNQASELHKRCMQCNTPWGLVTPDKLPVRVQPKQAKHFVVLCGGCFDRFKAQLDPKDADQLSVIDGRQLELAHC